MIPLNRVMMQITLALEAGVTREFFLSDLSRITTSFLYGSMP
jgi:hypothetical protein